MLLVVVPLVMGIIAAYSVSILTVQLILLIGVVALIYYYAIRGGPSDSGVSCGTFFIRTHYASSSSNWNRGAAFLHMLFGVVDLIVVMTVDHFILLYTIVQLIHLGDLALIMLFVEELLIEDLHVVAFYIIVTHFHQVKFGMLALMYHYALRGGTSSDGLICGTFCVIVSYVSGSAYWSRGVDILLC